jgi:hypothetical protein
VNTAGVVTGIVSGSVTISYSVTNTCGTTVATKAITVNALPNSGSIAGPSIVCTGSTITLTDSILGGTWSSSTTSVASISASGVVTGITAGTTTISYTVTTACGSAGSIRVITVGSAPTVAAITGATGVCAGSTTTLANATTGGTWSSTNTGVATISATGKISSGILELNGSAISTSDNSYLKINSGISLGDTSYNGYMLITNNSTTLPTMDFQNHNNSADGGFVNFVRGRGTDAGPLRLQNGDVIYSIGFASNGSGTTDGAAYILVSVDGATSAGIAPGAMSFAVANSAGAYLSALDIKSTGMVYTSYGLSTGTSQDLPPSTAASLDKITSYFITAAAETATLAVGTEGQYKNFVAQDVTAGNMVITVSNAGWKASGTGTITFSSRGQGCQLQYVNSKWHCIGNNGAVFA